MKIIRQNIAKQRVIPRLVTYVLVEIILDTFSFLVILVANPCSSNA